MSAPSAVHDPQWHAVSPKLVFVGPVGAGKTTAIAAVADRPPVRTDAAMSSGASGSKDTTTVALDFAELALDDGTSILLYSVPGQERFSHMRSIVLRGAAGVVLLVDASAETLLDDLRHWLDAIEGIDPSVPVVVGVTKADLAAGFSMRPLRDSARRNGRALPLFTLDPRQGPMVIQLLRTLVLQSGVDPGSG